MTRPPQSSEHSADPPAGQPTTAPSRRTPAPGRRPGATGSLIDAGQMLAVAGRLLIRHWPVLLTIFLAGVLLRELIVRVAVRASLASADLGMLVLLLAPMTTLAAMVLMLRTVRPSLPWTGADPTRPPPVLEHLGSVLIPFITIYYLEGDLFADVRDYAARVNHDEIGRILARIGQAADDGEPGGAAEFVDRLPYELTLSLAAVVVATFLGRALLGRMSSPRLRRWRGLPGAYLELIWITLVLVVALQGFLDLVDGWLGNRRLVVGLQQSRSELAGGLGDGSATGASAWFVEQLSQIDKIIVIPVAWLIIGGLVIRRGGDQPYQARGARLTRAQRWWESLPAVVRWPVDLVTGDLRARFGPLVGNVRMLWHAGAVPVMLFCVAFVAARSVPDWLWELERLVIGPRDTAQVWVPLAWPLEQANEAIGQAVAVCLLAAAIDWVARATAGRPRAAAPRAQTAAPATGTAAAAPAAATRHTGRVRLGAPQPPGAGEPAPPATGNLA